MTQRQFEKGPPFFSNSSSLSICFKKNKEITTSVLPNDAEACSSVKEEEMEEDMGESTSSKNQKAAGSLEDVSASTKSSIRSDLTVKVSLEEERKRFFADFDFESCAYTKSPPNNKFLNTKSFSFWTEGVELLDRYLHRYVETFEKEFSYSTQMTFNR